jgi:histidinol-phosphate/aromatic aminotransferase/cobyric acid decarboxylase-like protein
MPPFISNRFAEEAIPVALQDTGYIAAARDTVRAGHQWLEIEARPALSARIRILPAKANFALAQVTHPSKGFDLPSKLAARGILVRSGHDIEGLSNSWFRFSIRAERENRILTDTLLDLLN